MKECGKRFRRRPRLENFDYKGELAYSVTICTHDRKKVFVDPAVFEIGFGALKDYSKKHGFLIHAYCFMPDHIHLLVQGADGSSALGIFIKGFKQKSGFEYSKTYNAKLWQPSFYDHVLRREESIKDVALYIFENPVRKGLISGFRDYPFLGSLTFDVSAL